MASIGGVNCTFVRSTLPGASGRQTVHLWRSAGADGYAAQLQGLGDTEFRVVAVLHATAATVALAGAAVQAWYASLEAMQGAVVSIVDDWNATYTNCLLVRMGTLDKTRADAGTGFPGCRGEVTIEGVRV